MLPLKLIVRDGSLGTGTVAAAAAALSHIIGCSGANVDREPMWQDASLLEKLLFVVAGTRSAVFAQCQSISTPQLGSSRACIPLLVECAMKEHKTLHRQSFKSSCGRGRVVQHAACSHCQMLMDTDAIACQFYCSQGCSFCHMRQFYERFQLVHDNRCRHHDSHRQYFRRKQ
jgi:hypothetical protein